MYPRDELESHSVWMSAYLLVFGCEIVRVVPNGPRRSTFIHRNPDNRAFELAREWSGRDDTLVNAAAFVEAYRKVLHKARQAEDEEDHYCSENSQGGRNDPYEPRRGA